MKKLVVGLLITVGTATAVIAHEDGFYHDIGCSVRSYGPGCH